MKTCNQIKQCTESQYLHCPAYWSTENCWEIKEGYCCTLYGNDCDNCEIYLNHLKEKQKKR